MKKKNVRNLKFLSVLLMLCAASVLLISCSSSPTKTSDSGGTEEPGGNDGNNNGDGGNGGPSGPSCKAKDFMAPGADFLAQLKNVRRSAEKVQHRLSDDISGFGGIYIDENGNFTVLLTGPEGQASATAALSNEAEIRQKAAFSTGNVNFKQADFTFSDLAGWRELATAFLLTSSEFDYVLSTQVFERENKVAIGINEAAWNPQNLEALETYMTETLKIPTGAVLFEPEAPEVDERDDAPDFTTLGGSILNRQRPIVGGLQTRRGSSKCTMGFLGIYDGKEVFVTNSHCTDNPHNASQSMIYQGTANVNDDLAGVEIADGPFSYSACVTPNADCWPCRWSDSAIIAIPQDVDRARGYIAKTQQKSTQWMVDGSTEIDVTDPVFTIVDVEFDLFEGLEVQKVGANSGWTSGEIIRTCVDSRRSSHNIILQCQYRGKYATSGGGTSGSPVFAEVVSDIPDIVNPVALVGIHRSSSSRDQPGGYSGFSPIEGVLKDFDGLEGLTVQEEHSKLFLNK